MVAGRIGDRLVESIVDAFVRLAHPFGDDILVLTDHVDAIIGGKAVDDNKFMIACHLSPDAVQRVPQASRMVLVYGDDGYQGFSFFMVDANRGSTPQNLAKKAKLATAEDNLPDGHQRPALRPAHDPHLRFAGRRGL